MCPMPVLDIDCEGLISISRSTVRITTTSRSTGSVSDFGTELEPGMETDTKLQISRCIVTCVPWDCRLTDIRKFYVFGS